jgi:SAM-dependent methyltransferase
MFDSIADWLRAIDALRRGEDQIRDALPEFAALMIPFDPYASVDHAQAEQPLLAYVERMFQKLRALDSGSYESFQRGEGLDKGVFELERRRWVDLRNGGFERTICFAVAHLDFAKGGTPQQRQAWEALLGVDLMVHNEAAAHILRQARSLRALLEADQIQLMLALIESHGLVGQVIRGETPMICLSPWVTYLRSLEPAVRSRAANAFIVINLCVTGAVRENLLTNALHLRMLQLQQQWLEVAQGTAHVGDALQQLELSDARALVLQRLRSWRGARIAKGEPLELTERTVASLEPEVLEFLAQSLRRTQLWYVESGSAGLSSQGQLKLLLLGLRVDAAHLSLQPLLRRFSPNRPTTPYRWRLLESLLARISFRQIMNGEVLGGLLEVQTQFGGQRALLLDLEESVEAGALLTLLALFESKSSANYHVILKMLCDAYELRKDDFDRLQNENEYLVTMNAARTDKERMLRYARPGRIVEIGPGGGVILDLLEAHFLDSEIIGVDISSSVIEHLETRRVTEKRRWQARQADAFHLSEYFEPRSVDTIILCSVLHEIFSYVETDGKRYQLDSVRRILQAAFACLKPGGRIVIRDGVLPPPGECVLEFLQPQAKSFFLLYAQQFQARTVRFDSLDTNRVRVSTWDAAEFLLKYTWGPASFPYEIREQYCVLEYDAYRNMMLECLPGAVALELPPSLRSYFQDGYRLGLDGQVRLCDESGGTRSYPDSNAVWVLEKSL